MECDVWNKNLYSEEILLIQMWLEVASEGNCGAAWHVSTDGTNRCCSTSMSLPSSLNFLRFYVVCLYSLALFGGRKKQNNWESKVGFEKNQVSIKFTKRGTNGIGETEACGLEKTSIASITMFAQCTTSTNVLQTITLIPKHRCQLPK